MSEASVEMFDYMLEDNEDLMASFKKYFDNPKEDVAFIKELMGDKRKVCIRKFLHALFLKYK